MVFTTMAFGTALVAGLYNEGDPIQGFSSAYAKVQEQGVSFREQLSGDDVVLLSVARMCFLTTFFLPALLYYCRFAEKAPGFPATISYTIRQGPPRWAHHMSWIVGWIFWGAVFARGGVMVRLHALQMFLSGVLAVMVFPLKRGRSSSKHILGAVMYMNDHIVLLEWLAIPSFYCYLYFVCSMTLLVAYSLGAFLEHKYKIPHGEVQIDKDVKRKMIGHLPAPLPTVFYWCDFLAMSGEYGLFIAFVVAMPMGLAS